MQKHSRINALLRIFKYRWPEFKKEEKIAEDAGKSKTKLNQINAPNDE